MKPWELQIPKPPSNNKRKRCYIYWKILSEFVVAGGKVVWLTDQEKTFAYLRHPNIVLDEILEKDKLEEYKKYLDATLN
jgi:hypothetical protein